MKLTHFQIKIDYFVQKMVNTANLFYVTIGELKAHGWLGFIKGFDFSFQIWSIML